MIDQFWFAEVDLEIPIRCATCDCPLHSYAALNLKALLVGLTGRQGRSRTLIMANANMVIAYLLFIEIARKEVKRRGIFGTQNIPL